MEKIIKLDLKSEADLFETYNADLVSRNLIEYLVVSAFTLKTKDKLTIIVNNYTKQRNCVKLISDGFNVEYSRCLRRYHYNNVSQVIYFLLGVLILFVAAYLGDAFVLQELFLISGWVLIWEMVEIELFNDLENRKRRKILRRLKKATFIVNDF